MSVTAPSRISYGPSGGVGAGPDRRRLAERAFVDVHRVDDRAPGDVLLVGRPPRPRCCTGATQVSAGPSTATHSSRGGWRTPSASAARISSCRASSVCASAYRSRPEQPTEVAPELRLDRAHRDVPAVGAGVHVVAGVSAGEDVVARARARRRWPGTRRRRATSWRRRRPRSTRRGARPRRCARAAAARP